MKRLITTILALAATALLTACGGGNSTSPPGATAPHLRDASLMLDFTPNAIHSGIYLALARHYDHANGVQLDVQVPGASTDAVKMLDANLVNFAILDIHDLAIADAQGHNLVGVMAIVERPLASVIAQPQFTSPAQLVGHTVGVSGAPSDLAVLRSVVGGAGGDPSKVKTVTIGYNAVPDLLSKRVAAATAFWNDEGIQLTHDRPGFNVFRLEQYRAPSYPELVLCATKQEVTQDPSFVRAVVHTLVSGYDGVIKNPSAGVKALTSQVTGLKTSDVRRQLAAEVRAFQPIDRAPVGTLGPRTMKRWARWETEFGIVKQTPDIAAMFTQRFLPS